MQFFMETEQNYLDSVMRLLAYYKKLGEGAMAQLDEAQLNQDPAAGSNSIAAIVKHLHGNMRSRWTNFLQEDGEKSWRQRDAEFDNDLAGRKAVETAWEEGWQCVFDALRPLTPEQLSDVVYIRNEGHTVLEAINQQLAHYSYHLGQLVFLAKQLKGTGWQSLSIAPGQSEAYNQKKFDQGKGRRHFV